MVLDAVVGAAGEEAGDGGPLVAVEGVGSGDDGVLGGGEGVVLYGWGQLIAPPEAARLAGAARDLFADEGPVPRAVLLHQLFQSRVLLWAPRPFNPISAVH